MRFSTFLNARSLRAEDDRQLILDLIEHSGRAQRAGFKAIFIPDHHFNGYMPVASDPMMFASYLTALYPDMHIGFSVTSVPLHSPVRFAERVNILDQLTGGKLLVGIGSGTTPEEMIGFGVNKDESSAIAEGNLEIAEQLWAKEMEDPEIKFSNGPYNGRVLQRIAPAAFTPGHARLMPVAFKDSSVRRAAEHGWPAFIPAFTPPSLGGREPFVHVERHFTKYRDLLMAAGHSDERVAEALSWTTHTYQCVHVAETQEQARAELMEILGEYQAAVDRENAFNRRAEADPANKKNGYVPSALDDDWIDTWCLHGTPESVLEHLQPYADLGIGNILCGLTTGPLTERRMALANQTIDLMAKHVIPAFS